MSLRPEFPFRGVFHFPSAFGACVSVPDADVLAAAVGAKATHGAVERWCHVANDATHHQVLYGVAVGARHRDDFLAEESAPFVAVGFIAALVAAACGFPRHN